MALPPEAPAGETGPIHCAPFLKLTENCSASMVTLPPLGCWVGSGMGSGFGADSGNTVMFSLPTSGPLLLSTMAYLSVSVPTKPGFGVYVMIAPLRLRVPFAALDVAVMAIAPPSAESWRVGLP